MLFSNQFAKFFDHQYLQKETINGKNESISPIFFMEIFSMENVASKRMFCSLMCPDMPCLTQTFLDLI